MKVKANDLVMLTSGVYSDFDVEGFVQALADLDLDELRAKWATTYQDLDIDLDYPYFSMQDSAPSFAEYLCANQFAKECDYHEFHLYDYQSDLEGIIKKSTLLPDGNER